MKTAYKLFRLKKNSKGKIFPLFVLSDTEIPIGEWIKASEGEKINGKNKVKSRIGPLCFRPGFHLSDLPLAIHIGEKGASGNIEYMSENHVWCLCEYDDTNNYQEEANKNGIKNNKINPKFAYLTHIPENGFYRYKTSPNMLGDWIISGNIRVIKLLDDDEVENILKKQGYSPMKRKNGKIDLKKYGF